MSKGKRRSKNDSKPVPVTSREVWQIIEYYAQNGAPRVKAVARKFLRERDE